MGITNVTGPLVVGSTDQDVGPSVSWGGAAMLLDMRNFMIGGASPIYGWGGTEYLTVKQVPSTLANNNIAAASAGPGGGTLTLVSASAAGITVGVVVAGKSCLAIDLPTAGTTIPYGNPISVQAYDPRKSIARAIRVVSSAAGDNTQTLTVRGFDLYGVAMSENITLNGTNPVNGKKAWKYIFSITNNGATTAGTINVGTTDIYGFPLLVSGTPGFNGTVAQNQGGMPYVAIFWNASNTTAPVFVTATTGIVCGDATSPATATTGDVRGTWLAPTASNSTPGGPPGYPVELTISQFVAPWLYGATAGQPATTAYQGIFGVPQFAN